MLTDNLPHRFSSSPVVSVILPALQAEQTLPRAVQSVQSQSFADWELLIINDGSSDDTASIAKDFSKGDPRIRVLGNQTRQGAARARNLGIAAAQGRYIAFLDADDHWLPKKLEKQVALLQETSTAFSYTGFWREARNVRREITVPKSLSYSELLHGNQIGCQTAMYDTKQLGKLFMDDIRMRHDYALWLRILKTVPIAYGLQEPLAVHCRQKESLSSNPFKAMRATLQVYRLVAGASYPLSLWYLANHLANRGLARFGKVHRDHLDV